MPTAEALALELVGQRDDGSYFVCCRECVQKALDAFGEERVREEWGEWERSFQHGLTVAALQAQEPFDALVEREKREAVAREREACAKRAQKCWDECARTGFENSCQECGVHMDTVLAAIRARGEEG